MKLAKKASFLLCLLIVTNTAYSQYRWYTLPNAPFDDTRFEDIYFIDPDTGWIINLDYPNLYRTTDGGNSWIDLSDSAIGYPRSISFANSQTGWIGTYL